MARAFDRARRPARSRPAAASRRSLRPVVRGTAGIAGNGIHGIKSKAAPKERALVTASEKAGKVPRETAKPLLSWNNSKVIR
jgi:hypothetical protein